MSKFIIFSRVFPKYHPKSGTPTFFVEKIWKYVWDAEKSRMNPLRFYQPNYDDIFHPMGEGQTNIHQYLPKLHTIRGGNKWKVGDKFSSRVWGDDINPKSGRSGPYHSKQIILCDDIEIKQIYKIRIWRESPLNWRIYINGKGLCPLKITELAKNDGLTHRDLLDWFIVPDGKNFEGQIICWSDNVSY